MSRSKNENEELGEELKDCLFITLALHHTS